MPLHEAAFGGVVSLVEILVEHGANVDALDRDGNSAVHRAIEGKKSY